MRQTRRRDAARTTRLFPPAKFVSTTVIAAVVSLSASASVSASTSDAAAVAVMSRFVPSKLWAIIVNLQCTYKMPST